MHIDGLLVRWPTGAEQRINKSGKAVCFADHYVGVLVQLRVVELTLEQLGRTANAAEWVFDFVSKLANHLSAGAVLDQQRILTADLDAACYVGDLNQQSASSISTGDTWQSTMRSSECTSVGASRISLA